MLLMGGREEETEKRDAQKKGEAAADDVTWFFNGRMEMRWRIRMRK